MKILQQIDEAFAARQPKELWMMLILLVIAIFALSYQYLFPISQKILQKAQREYRALEQKYNMDKAYIQAMSPGGDSNFYIRKYQSQIEKLKLTYNRYSEEKNYIDFKIRQLSYLLYNKKRWAQFLDSIASKAIKNGVSLEFLANSFPKAGSDFGHVLEIETRGYGKYRDIIKFLNALEESVLLRAEIDIRKGAIGLSENEEVNMLFAKRVF